MADSEYHDAVHAIIEQVFLRGVPLLVVDATRPGVIAPEHAKKTHGQDLHIALSPDYPLELEYAKDGLHATLAFSGTVMRCTFPWTSIWMVSISGTTEAVLIPSHAPPGRVDALRAQAASVAAPKEPEPPRVALKPRPFLRVLQGGKKTPDLRAVPPAPPNGKPPPKAS